MNNKLTITLIDQKYTYFFFSDRKACVTMYVILILITTLYKSESVHRDVRHSIPLYGTNFINVNSIKPNKYQTTQHI